jgi:hypothetical protein
MSTSGHDFIPYLETITAELQGIKDRVRRLVRHWPSDGHFKEAIFRKILRRHLPESVVIGTGFVVNAFDPSGEIDILVVDRKMPILFREDELLIVTPEAVKAVIEVKSSLEGPAKIQEAVDQLAKRMAIIQRHGKKAWGGLFVYEGDRDRHEAILEALLSTYNRCHIAIDFVAFGEDTVVKFYPKSGHPGAQEPNNSWHSFHVPVVAPAEFIASLAEYLVPEGTDLGSFAWFKPPAGFERRFHAKAAIDGRVQRFEP